MIAEYITKEELQQYLVLQDEELNEQYQQLRKANSAYYVREVKVTFRTPFSWKHPFRRREEVATLYEVLEDLDGKARICCFPTAKGSEWISSTWIGELDLKTFIYGYLNGTDAMLKELKRHHGKPKFPIGDLVKVVNRDIYDKICEEHGWTTSCGYGSLCGRQFTVTDIRYSYASNEYTYQIECHSNSAWIREKLLEACEP